MNDKYCPAGKCFCDRYSEGSRDHYAPIRFCTCTDSIPAHQIMLNYFEVCPWPSRQVRLEVENVKTLPGYKLGATAGLAEGFRRAREAVENVVTYSVIGIGPSLVARHDALVAIDEAEKEVKK